ncbi:hypothetical protein DSO57_1007902 [Entomophthora muscae]|uniref:Uncharacterized protein n=1 Tax=Entomophthora muscae TaxID=34485 RepID=A0ACC2T789_9FUNG|nr:hypothetical protein DSO57_1007902 [Entomophthora muscae]
MDLWVHLEKIVRSNAKVGSEFTAALKTLSQDPCPTGKPPMDPKPAKSKDAKSHVIFHLNSSLVDHQVITPSRDQPANLPQALYRPPGAPFGPMHFTEYPPNPAYAEFNLEKNTPCQPSGKN